MSSAARVAIGFCVKSGWASAVVASGSASSIRVIDSRRIDLSDPVLPESRQPYHAGTGTVRPDGPELSRLIASVERYGRQSVADTLDRYQRDGHHPVAVGVVTGSLVDPDTIANGHIRIHALEGRLFRRVVENAVAERQLSCSIWRERDLLAVAERELHRQPSELRRILQTCGEHVTGAWRAEQKAATLAAWLVLSGLAVAQPF